MLIVATAGHIDHGKTSLVRALTGFDTDRLPEERARGFSIDLGFAYRELGAGELVAFVDVPGHQRFIRNMLAGVAAIHFAMLVVAVDDGPMPQTLEHIQILDFLGVHRGVVVLSKADRAPAGRIAEVDARTRELLAGTTLAGIPSIVASARTGAGIAQLQALLADAAREHEAARSREGAPARRTRFSIDRVFTVKGAGTVVTGTVSDGRLACDDRVRLLPDGLQLRVRGIQVHGRDVRRAASGERAAVNVAGTELSKLARGQWLAASATRASGDLLDVQLRMLPGVAPLRHASPARLYLGASELGCRVLLHGKALLEPGASSAARLHLERPVLAVNGDRFVLRDAQATRTVAGGRVVDPCPPGRRRFTPPAEFEALAAGDPAAALRVLLEARGAEGVALDHFDRIFNLAEEAKDEAVRCCDAVVVGKARPLAVTRDAYAALVERAASALRSDERPTVRIPALRQAVAPAMPLDAFESLLRAEAGRLAMAIEAGSVGLKVRQETLRSADRAAWERVRPWLAQAQLSPPDLATLATASGVPAGRLRVILHAQARAGELFQLRPDKYIVRELAAQLAAAAARTASSQDAGRFTAAQYRDSIGTGRTLAIHVLEMLDVAGVTRRDGDARTILRAPELVFGPSDPFAAQPQQVPLRATSMAGRMPRRR